MKAIIIDDNKPFAESLCKKFNNVENCDEQFLISSGFEKLNELADKIIKDNVKNTIKDDIVLFINVNLKTGTNTRQLQKGIELLKWLRFKECYNHCVLYSFQNLVKIIKINPLNSILLSKGVTFILLPQTHESFISNLSYEKAERENLLPFFRAEVDLVKIRHELANIWGLERFKWATIDQYSIKESNYEVALLHFLNGNPSKMNNDQFSTLRKKISVLKNWFIKNNPVIYYYDDMAAEWGPILKDILGDNFHYITPKSKSTKLFIEELSRSRPKCLLLDLRLENEKFRSLDPLKFSGGKLLVDIKRKYYTLPIIMFTATNKAESVRRLLSSGAEYVWTKEGIDDGIDDIITLQNTIDLLQKIKNCVFKFKNEVYETIYEAETKISNTFFANEYIQNILTKGELKNIKTIVFDTNYLLDGLKNINALLTLHKILLANAGFDISKKKKIVIHDDVYYELFKISKGKEVKNKDDDYFRVPASRYLIKLLYDWRKNGLLWNDFDYGQQTVINNTSKINTDKLLSPIEQIELEEKTFFEKITELFNDQLSKDVEEINKKIDDINKGIQSMPDLKKLSLHFDDTLKALIPKYLEEGDVIFVTNDNTCAYNVGQLFIEAEIINKINYMCKLNPYNKNEITVLEGIQSAMIDNSTYNHLMNSKFVKLFTYRQY